VLAVIISVIVKPARPELESVLLESFIPEASVLFG
jgi:hypothetical protein